MDVKHWHVLQIFREQHLAIPILRGPVQSSWSLWTWKPKEATEPVWLLSEQGCRSSFQVLRFSGMDGCFRINSHIHLIMLHWTSIFFLGNYSQNSRGLSLGSSVPWPLALEVITGMRRMTTEPIIEYFRPLEKFLETFLNRRGECIGWRGNSINSFDLNLACLLFLLLNIFICPRNEVNVYIQVSHALPGECFRRTP